MGLLPPGASLMAQHLFAKGLGFRPGGHVGNSVIYCWLNVKAAEPSQPAVYVILCGLY